ncbi:hypothetical protein AAG747_07620 [Rapidithrix thailandica]|uniref:Uncharacterized protein n=1 Tax=Rapidithrix thailandica TaxID=413964 RepID=A0AAW9S3V7_9BACT
MKTRIAKKIVKKKEDLKYNREQLRKADTVVGRYERRKKADQ